jgi:hypothetical protein
MNRFKSFLIGMVLVLMSSFAVQAQTILTNTTLAAAVDTMPGSTTNFAPGVSAGLAKTIKVASATGITAPSTTDSTKDTYLVVDAEWMHVLGVNGTVITVQRGAHGTRAASHANSATVFVVPTSLSTYFRNVPQGACTRTNEPLLPRIDPVTSLLSDCLNGQWVTGDAVTTQRTLNNLLRLPDPGATALTALETAGTAPSANTEIYCTELDLPFSMMLTGIASLNGTTVGSDKHWVILYDAGGNVLANSAAAGATTSGASTYQKFNFTSKFYAVGPARYFGCVGTNGTTDTIRHAITAVNDNILGGTITAQVFGTAAAITAPSSFTTAKAPYLAVF